VAEKGLRTLLAARARLKEQIPLKIVGDGPLADEVRAASARTAGVEWLGACTHERVLAVMKEAWALVFPSLYYENFPIVIAEAYAAGLPIIGSDVGSMSLLIDHGRTGLHVRPNDPADLVAKLEWLWTHPEERARMGRNARLEFEQKYTAERNYKTLMEIYALASTQSSVVGSQRAMAEGRGVS
jgi:glycosyltransferase involved in cell wall biosynthesis